MLNCSYFLDYAETNIGSQQLCFVFVERKAVMFPVLITSVTVHTFSGPIKDTITTPSLSAPI